MSKNPEQKDIDEILKYYESGNFKKVKKLALEITKNYPNNQFGWKALGVALKMSGELSDALIANKKSIKINPVDPEAHYNLGNTLKQLNKLDEAVISYKKSIQLKTDYAAAYNNLADVFKNQGKIEETIVSYKKAIQLNPNYAEAYNNLGITFKELGRLDESLNSYKKAIQLNPNYAEAYNNLGITFKELGRLDESLNSYKKAIQLNPNYAGAYNNLGIIFRELGELYDSEKSYRKAIKLNPNYYEGYFNLGITLRDLGRLGESESNYKKAIELDSNRAELYNNLGVVLRELGKLDESEQNYEKAIKLKPDYADAYNNNSFTLLLKHDFKKAYDFSEWRWKTKHKIGEKFNTSKPLWKGESGKRILIWKEQGIGDEIIFCSMLSELKAKSEKLIVHCDKRLIPLFKRSLSKDIIFEGSKNNINEKDYDVHIPMGSVAKYFRENLKSFSVTSKGYLKADKDRTLKIRNKLLKDKKQTLIGISWYTKSRIQMASFRNIFLNDLVSVLKNNDTKIVSLQYDHKSDEIEDLKKNNGIEINLLPEVDNRNDLDGLASLISACDLVVSIDNFTVHLAGSLGVKTKILLPYTMDARWGFEGEKSYLYKSVKLYRQTELGDWKKVLKKLENDL